jgi:hypothetical protein
LAISVGVSGARRLVVPRKAAILAEAVAAVQRGDRRTHIRAAAARALPAQSCIDFHGSRENNRSQADAYTK